MIYQNSRSLDMGDVAVLFAAMCAVNTSELAEQADRSLVGIGYDEGLARCTFAAQVIAEKHWEEGDNSDGCWWFEILEGSHAGSLAYDLFMMEETQEEAPEQWKATITNLALEYMFFQQAVILFAVNNLEGETLFCVLCQEPADAELCIPEGLEDKFEVGQCSSNVEIFEAYTVYQLPSQADEVTTRLLKGE